MGARLLLALSVAVNVILAFMIARQGEFIQDSPKFRRPRPRPVPIQTIKTNVVVRRQSFQWSEIESEDFPVYIANLKAIGCPPDTIRDIIVAEVNQLFARRRAAEIVGNDQQWWRSEPDAGVLEAAANQTAALDIERRNLLTQLLGVGWESNNVVAERGPGRMTDPILGKVSAEIKEKVAQIERDSARQLDDYVEGQLAGKPVDPSEVLRVRMQARNELAKILTPEQFEEYLLRYSDKSDRMRAELKGFGASQEEFRSIFRATDSIDAQIAALGGATDAASVQRRKELEQSRDAALQQTLGDRFALYKLTQDPLFRDVQASAEQIGAPPEKVLPVYKINQLTVEEKARIQADARLTPDERAEALKTVEQQKQNSLRQLLGDETYERLHPAQ